MYAPQSLGALDTHQLRELQHLVERALGIADTMELWAVGISLDKARLALLDVQDMLGAPLTLQ